MGSGPAWWWLRTASRPCGVAGAGWWHRSCPWLMPRGVDLRCRATAAGLPSQKARQRAGAGSRCPFSWLGVPGAGPCRAADSGPSHARPQMAARERPPRAGCPPAASPVGQHRGLRNLGCGLGAAVLCPPGWSCVCGGLWQLRRGLGETFLVQLWSRLCFSVGQRWKKAPERELLCDDGESPSVSRSSLLTFSPVDLAPCPGAG